MKRTNVLKSSGSTLLGMVSAFICLTMLALNSAKASTPQLITYQALITDPSGVPINQTVNIQFKIWTQANGGLDIWTETHNSMPITDGKLSVLLGSITTLNSALLEDTGLYLGVKVGADPEIVPRNRLATVPFAYRINTIDGASGGDVAGALRISPDPAKTEGDALIIKNSGGQTVLTAKVSPSGLVTVSLFDPVDSKDGFGAVPVEKVQISKDGIVIFDSTGTDTTITISSTGDITGTGQIQVGENASSANATTVFGVNNDASGDTATISGGAFNTASADFSTIGGGYQNSVSAAFSTNGGGYSNASSNFFATIGGGADNTVTGQYSTISGGTTNVAVGNYSVVSGGSANQTDSNYAVISGGVNNLISAHYATIGGGWENTADGSHSTISGGYDSYAEGAYSAIGGGRQDTAKGTYSGVASGYSNLAGSSTSDTGAFVGGGYNNTAIYKFATVSGGKNNVADSTFATIAGGELNTASFPWSVVGGGGSNTSSASMSTVAGGASNLASGTGSTIGGGYANFATGDYSYLGGGSADTASGLYSSIPGGYRNIASSDYAFAAGRRARAVHSGAFVWSSDAFSGTSFSSTASNQFNVRAPGGVRIYTNDTLATGVTMGAGASAWTAVSDKSVKKDFREINSDELLKKLSEIPISRWKYIAEESQADHIGPMSQDFYSAFGLGDDDKRISTIDADGVALAAIQALHKQNLELKKELEQLRKEVKELSKQ